MRRLTLLFAVFMCLTFLIQPVHAWKPKTHIYVANVIMADALDNNKVWIPPFGEFAVDPQVLAAMRTNPDQFRAGAVGPDGFPDMWTGQVYIHPNTDPWLQHLSRCLQESDGASGRAFVYGYFTHCAGDMWAHDWVNYYAQGSWPGFSEIAANPSLNLPKVARHLAVETTLDKRVSVSQRTIDIPNDFVYNKMLLHQGAKTAGMNPVIQHYVDLYWQKYPKRNDTIAAGVKTYDANWWADLDEGLRNWVAANETALKQSVEGDTNLVSSLGINLGPWAFVHILDMEGAPSSTKAAAGVLLSLSDATKAALHALGLDVIIENIEQRFVDWMLKKLVGMDEQTFKNYMEGEATTALFPNNLNQLMNDISTVPAESAWIHSNTDHARFQQFINSINGPLYNSVITGKIAILAPGEYGKLSGTSTQQAGMAALLGQLRCIDASKQYCAASDGGLRNLLGYGQLGGQPNSRPAFPYIFKPYTPVNQTDKTTLWMQRESGNTWKSGYRTFMDAKFVDPQNTNIAIGLPGAMLLWRPAESRTGAWNVVSSVDGLIRTQMAVQLGKQYIFRPMHSQMNYSGSSTMSFNAPVDLYTSLQYSGTPVVKGNYTALNSAITGGSLDGTVSDLVSLGDTGIAKPVKLIQIYKTTEPDKAEKWPIPPVARKAYLQYELSALPTSPFGVTGNTLGLPTGFAISLGKCRINNMSKPGVTDMWLTGMKGTLKVKLGYYGICPKVLPEVHFTVDRNGNAVWGCKNLQEVYQAGVPKSDQVVVEVGSHPGTLHIDVEIIGDIDVEKGARISYGYTKVGAAFDGLPGTLKTTQPYQQVQNVLSKIVEVIGDPAAAEANLRTAISGVPDQQSKDKLVQALDTAMLTFPDPQLQDEFTAGKATINQYGNIQGSLGNLNYWPALCSAIDLIVFPNIDGADSDATPPALKLSNSKSVPPGGIQRPQQPGPSGPLTPGGSSDPRPAGKLPAIKRP